MIAALNVLVFQAGWFACVLGAAHGYPWAGAATGAALAAAWIAQTPRPAAESGLAAAGIAAGACLDSALAATGLVKFAGAVPLPWLAPVWILALWMLFATTLNASLRWLRGRSLLACGLGALGGPASYWAGERLGALRLDGAAALVAVAAGWALALPVLMALAARTDRA
jgi:hypothetical protein